MHAASWMTAGWYSRRRTGAPRRPAPALQAASRSGSRRGRLVALQLGQGAPDVGLVAVDHRAVGAPQRGLDQRRGEGTGRADRHVLANQFAAAGLFGGQGVEQLGVHHGGFPWIRFDGGTTTVRRRRPGLHFSPRPLPIATPAAVPASPRRQTIGRRCTPHPRRPAGARAQLAVAPSRRLPCLAVVPRGCVVAVAGGLRGSNVGVEDRELGDRRGQQAARTAGLRVLVVLDEEVDPVGHLDELDDVRLHQRLGRVRVDVEVERASASPTARAAAGRAGRCSSPAGAS